MHCAGGKRIQMLRAAIVGLGWWGKNLVTSVQGKTDEIRFTVCCTRSPRNGRRVLREHSIALVDDYAAVLSDPAVDAVVLATPPSVHAASGSPGRGSAGKHVFVEKPFTLTAETARQAIAAAQRRASVWRLALTGAFTRR